MLRFRISYFEEWQEIPCGVPLILCFEIVDDRWKRALAESQDAILRLPSEPFWSVTPEFLMVQEMAG